MQHFKITLIIAICLNYSYAFTSIQEQEQYQKAYNINKENLIKLLKDADENKIKEPKPPIVEKMENSIPKFEFKEYFKKYNIQD